MLTSQTMNAMVVSAYGEAEVLHYRQVPIPSIDADEILVQVYSAGVSPFDVHVREGWYKTASYYSLPLILGWEVSGVVVAVGKNVSRFSIGDSVFAYPNAFHNGGGYAEYVAIKEMEAVHKPSSISHPEAAAASMNAMTAWQALFDTAKLAAGQKILIHAAAGGVGHLAVQLAKWKGAYVIGTASGKNREFLQSLGVDEIIDYTSTAFENAVKEVDVVLDTIGGDTLKKSFLVAKKGGIVLSIIDFENIKRAADFGLQGMTLFATPNHQQLATIATLLADGKIKSHVSEIIPLKEAAKAHHLIQTGRTRGKVVLTMG